MKMTIKSLIILGLIVGIAFFFIGAIISNVFPSSSTDLLSYKISSSIKLLGIGVVIGSMVVGGIYIEDIDKNLKLLLLLLGLVLLVVYTIGSQSLEWYLPTSQTPTGIESYEHRPTGYGVPGFELILVLGALVITLIILKKRHDR
jgi:MFS family permease